MTLWMCRRCLPLFPAPRSEADGRPPSTPARSGCGVTQGSHFGFLSKVFMLAPSIAQNLTMYHSLFDGYVLERIGGSLLTNLQATSYG